MATLWITGARGFIGRHLAAYLAAQGHAVAGIGHGHWPPSEAREAGLRDWVNGDIAPATLHRLAASVGAPAAVFHLAGGSSVAAAIASPLEDFARTVTSTMQMLDWLQRELPATAIVVVSSAAVYGGGHTGPIDEAAATVPYSPYGHHKLMMEQACRSYASSYGLKAVIARLFSVYGPGLRKQILWDLCSRVEQGQSPIELGGSGHELRDWTHVDDVVRILCALSERAAADVPVFNVGSGRAASVAQVAQRVLSEWGGSAAVRFSGLARPGDPFSLIADGRRLSAAGLKCTADWEAGVAEYVTWFRSRPGADE